jgi:hypothetical protein
VKVCVTAGVKLWLPTGATFTPFKVTSEAFDVCQVTIADVPALTAEGETVNRPTVCALAIGGGVPALSFKGLVVCAGADIGVGPGARVAADALRRKPAIANPVPACFKNVLRLSIAAASL